MKISVIIPVGKEQDKIENLLECLLKDNKREDLEVIIVDSYKNSILDKIKIKDYRLIKMSSKRIRSIQMNKGARYASGDVLFFLYPDSIVEQDVFNEIDKIMEKKDVGAFLLESNSTKLLSKFRLIIRNISSVITSIPLGEQGIFIKNDVFQKIGTYPEFVALEDVHLMKKLKEEKIKIYISKFKIKTMSKKWNDN